MDTKIRLSPKELRLAKDAGIILTKNAVLQKVKQLFGELQTLYHAIAIEKSVVAGNPKISRGENYQDLPWVMLDYPRYFDRSDIRAIRTMFWWGNYFSITLHLSGSSKDLAESRIVSSYKSLKKQAFYICRSDEQWKHEINKENYVSVDSINQKKFESIVRDKTFVKLAVPLALKNWHKLNKEFVPLFGSLLEMAF
jgi:hypothetical protein